MFASLYILFGMLVVPLHDRVQRAIPPLSANMHPLAALAVALGLLLAFAIVLPVVLFGFSGGRGDGSC